MTRAYLNAYEQLPAADLLARYDADAAELHRLMLEAGAVDRFADRPDTRDWDGYRYTLTLPGGSLWRVGGVSAVSGTILTRFDDAAEGQRYAKNQWPMGANPITGKFNQHSALPGVNLERIAKVLASIQAEAATAEPEAAPEPNPACELDQLYAYHPVTGKLHSCSPDYADYDFEAAMLRQGYRVERVPASVVRERYLARERQRLSPKPAAVSAVPAEEEGPVQGVPTSATLESLPAVGDWIEHSLLGLAQVTHTLTMPDGVQVPVCAGRCGAGIVKPGEWAPAALLDVAEPAEPPLAPTPPLPPLPIPTPSGQVYYQPSLF